MSFNRYYYNYLRHKFARRDRIRRIRNRRWKRRYGSDPFGLGWSRRKRIRYLMNKPKQTFDYKKHFNYYWYTLGGRSFYLKYVNYDELDAKFWGHDIEYDEVKQAFNIEDYHVKAIGKDLHVYIILKTDHTRKQVINNFKTNFVVKMEFDADDWDLAEALSKLST